MVRAAQRRRLRLMVTTGTWTVDVSDPALKDGNVSVAVAMTNDAGNTASASTSFDLDTTADLEDDTILDVSVDSVINDAESGDVTLTLSGVDADAETVTVTLTNKKRQICRCSFLHNYRDRTVVAWLRSRGAGVGDDESGGVPG